MAQPITSYGYPRQAGNNGAIDSTVGAKFWPRVAGRFSVVGPTAWKVSQLGGLDRGLKIEAGTGIGDAVMDVLAPEYDTLQLPAPAGASQWFLVAARRNWAAPSTTRFVAIPGTAEKRLPARSDNPGVESDQPLALCRVTAGQTVVQEVIDLRCWTGASGLEAADVLALTYLAVEGAAVKIGPAVWRYELQGPGIWGWHRYGLEPVMADYTPTWNGLQYRGDTFTSKGRYWLSGDTVRVQAMLQSWTNPSLGLKAVSFTLPFPVGSDFLVVGEGVAGVSGFSGPLRRVEVVAAPGATTASVWASPMGGNVFIPPGEAGFPWGHGSAFYVSLEYRTSAVVV